MGNNQSYWNKERVVNGLERFIRDYYQGKESNLPTRAHPYRFSIPDKDIRYVKKMRLYPPYQVVLRYFKSFCDAWKYLGYEVQETPLEYWTREKVIEGLKRFHEDFGYCPTQMDEYYLKSRFSPKYGKSGELKENGAYNKYPSFPCIRKFFPSMRDAWTGAGFDVNQWWQPWSVAEDWFILESVGIIPRTEVAELLKRTVPAIKRRLYDLGRINSKNRWGISVTKAGYLLNLGGHVIQKYLDYGMMPYFRGNKVIYLNPADLLLVKEFDWNSEIPVELDELVRKALIVRLAKILTFRENWRSHEIYTFNKKKDYLASRIKNPRKSAFAEKLPDPPNQLKAGDWVTLVKRVKQVAEDRKGVIKAIFYSPQKQPRVDGTKRNAWIANVEFPKLRRCADPQSNRIRYNLPMDMLLETDAPVIEPKPLSMHPEAIRGRQRFQKHIKKAGERFESIKNHITQGGF